jgi:cytochrome P450
MATRSMQSGPDREEPDRPIAEIPLAEIDVSRPSLFQSDKVGAFFERLRREDPVHYCSESAFGPYWSITRYNDIMAVDTNHKLFSSEAKLGGIAIQDMHNDATNLELEMFIAMDQPKHDAQRKAVTPAVAPSNLLLLEPVIRERAGAILDSLPVGEEIDWVKSVSVELTTMTLATLFDFPWDERAKLTRWSDVTTAIPGSGIVESNEQRREELIECAMYFKGLWDQRVDRSEGSDLITMMANSPATREMPFLEFLGNLLLLIVGGNDTTRNSISGGVIALNQNPDQYEKLRQHPSLIGSMVPEIIRRHVVSLGQPGRNGDREARRIHHRPKEPAPASVIRLRDPSLHGQPSGRTAAADHLGRDPQALPPCRDGG